MSMSVNTETLWLQIERIVRGRNVVQGVINEQFLKFLLEDARNEKDRIETEQILARVMYKPCFNEEIPHKMSVKKKFRNLALYYYLMQDYAMFGIVVLSSIIREWPVKITSADDNKPSSKVWDRAPMSIAMKGGNIRKDGDKYVIRVLALEEEDIGRIISRADVSTQLMTIDDKGLEGPTSAYIIELNREGGERKRENSTVGTTTKRGKGTRNRNRDETQSPVPPYFENGFEFLPGSDGSLVFSSCSGKTRSDYVAEDSNNIIFTINNISINDPSNRSSINQKYILKSHFEFLFVMMNGGTFITRSDISTDYNKTDQFPVRSMTFEAATNPSTHWRKSFSSIWDALFIYYCKRGELFNDEIGGQKDENKNILRWVHVKDMIRHFISCRSEYHVRELEENEIRTISRMILARRLVEYNKDIVRKSNGNENDWIVNQLPQSYMDKIQEALLHIRISQYKHGQTFTETLNEVMQRVNMPDDFLVKQSDFSSSLIVLANGYPEEASCTIFSWLHHVAEIIAGSILHFGSSKASVRLFNDYLITLRSSESVKKTVQKILSENEKKEGQSSNVLMIRIDERDESRLLFEMIDSHSPDNQPYHFGFYNAKSIKESRMNFNKSLADRNQVKAAMEDGVISKTKGELCGIFAILKTGYLSGFHKIVKSQHGQIILSPIYKSSDESMYPYDFTPADMVEKEINPLIGPMRKNVSNDDKLEVYSVEESVIASMKSMRIARPTLQSIPQSQAQSTEQEQYESFTTPYPPQPQQVGYAMAQSAQNIQTGQPFVQYVQNIHHVHNYIGDSPPFYGVQPQEVTYSTQGVQTQHPFTPSDPVNTNRNNGMIGMSNPNYENL